MLANVTTALARRASALRAATADVGAVRWQSKGKAKKAAAPAAAAAAADNAAEALAANATPEALTSLFTSFDAANPSGDDSGSTLPITVSGPHAEWVEVAWASSKADVKALSTLTAQLAAVADIAASSDYGINRFFIEADHLPEENVKALNLLLTEAEPLKSLESIADTETKEYLVGDDATLKAWKEARAAVKGAKLGAPTTALLNAMASAGATFRTARVLEALGEIIAATSPTAEVTVESAVELSAAQKKDVKAALKGYLPEGKKDMNVAYAVDSSLTGGLIVHLDTVTVDLSSTSILVAATASAQAAEQRA